MAITLALIIKKILQILTMYVGRIHTFKKKNFLPFLISNILPDIKIIVCPDIRDVKLTLFFYMVKK